LKIEKKKDNIARCLVIQLSEITWQGIISFQKVLKF